MNKEELVEKQWVRHRTVALRGEVRCSHDTNVPWRKPKMAKSWSKEASGKVAHVHHGSERSPVLR
jgi:hypothetical protein